LLFYVLLIQWFYSTTIGASCMRTLIALALCIFLIPQQSYAATPALVAGTFVQHLARVSAIYIGICGI
jgi:hypothetical protein